MLRIEAEVDPRPGRYISTRVRLEFADHSLLEKYAHVDRKAYPQGYGDACAAAMENALAMIGEQVEPEPEPESEPEPEPKPKPKPKPKPCYADSPDSSCEPRADPRHISANLQVAAAGTVGLSDNVGGGVRVRVGFDRKGFRMQLQGGGDFGGQVRWSDGTLAVRRDNWDVGLRTCGVPRWKKKLQIPVCLDVAGGALVLTPTPGDGLKPWAWSSLTAGLAWNFKRFALIADLGPAVARTGELTDARGEALISNWSLFGRASLGVQARF